MLIIYLVFSAVLFGITGIIAQREVKSRTDFKILLGGGTYNVYRYYVHLKKNNEKLSIGFKLFLIAHVNFIICTILWFYKLLTLNK